MDFEKFANESTSDTIQVKVKKHQKLILISLSVALILVVTILSIILTRGESTSPAVETTFENAPTGSTYEFHNRLNRFHSVKLNVSCTIPGTPNEKCPEDMKAYEEMEERGMLRFLKNEDNSVDVFFSRTNLTIDNTSLRFIKRTKSIVNVLEMHLTEKEQEGFVYNEEDFGKNWKFGVKIAQYVFISDNLEDIKPKLIHCLSNFPVSNVLMGNNCSFIRVDFGNTFVKGLFRYVFKGATRLNGTATIGYDKPWVTVELEATAESDGEESVRKRIHQFNQDEIAICKCLKNTSMEELQTCFRNLKISKNQDFTDRSRCKFLIS